MKPKPSKPRGSQHLTQPALQATPAKPDQVLRLHGFRGGHPGVTIGVIHGCWQALIPEGSGETVLTRYLLQDLLDELDEVLDQPPPLSG